MLIGRWNNRWVDLASVAGLSGISGISDILRYGDHILSNPVGSVVLSVLTVSLAPSIPRVLPVCLVPFVPPVLFIPAVPPGTHPVLPFPTICFVSSQLYVCVT